jgi:hypothetical protein
MNRFLPFFLALLVADLAVAGTNDQHQISADEEIQGVFAQFSEALFPPESTLIKRDKEADKINAREALVRLEPLIEKDRIAGLKQLFLFRLTNPRHTANPKSASGILLTYFVFTFNEIEVAKKDFSHLKDANVLRFFRSFSNLEPEEKYLELCKERRKSMRLELGIDAIK